jgi:polar amino acid transport system substrate-binding protein
MHRHIRRSSVVLGAFAVSAMLALSACADPSTGDSQIEEQAPGREEAIAAIIDKVEFNQDLHDALPKTVLDAGKLTVASFNAQPPWVVPSDNPNEFTGVTADFAAAFEKLLGVKLERHALAGLAEIKTGIQAERYDFAFGPTGDSVAGQETLDFLDWVREHVVFAVPEGNPLGLNTLEDTCGVRMAVIAGGSAEQVLNDTNTECVAAGKEPAEILTFAQQPAAILAVQSDRADAYFSSQALLTFYVQQEGSGLELAATNQDNGFPDFFQGAAFPKDSELLPVMVDAFTALQDAGVYQDILTEWGLEDAVLDEIGVNLRTF